MSITTNWCGDVHILFGEGTVGVGISELGPRAAIGIVHLNSPGMIGSAVDGSVQDTAVVYYLEFANLAGLDALQKAIDKLRPRLEIK